MWNQYQPVYSEYMETKIAKFFDNVTDDYSKQEAAIVQKFVEKRERSMFQTEFLGHMSDYMFEFADQVKESLFGERLFDLLQIVVRRGPMFFFAQLSRTSKDNSS